jgi:hypothetical protein
MAGVLVVLLRLSGDRGPAPARSVPAEPQAFPGDPGIADLKMDRWTPLQFPPPQEMPQEPSTAPPPPPARVVLPGPPPPIAPEAEVAADGPTEVAAVEPQEDQIVPDAAPLQAPNSAASTASMPLHLRSFASPDMLHKLVNKRKIDASVVLQPLVGADGRVHDIRVLQTIANCEECTRSAIAAVEQYVYDAPPAGAGQVWTTPVEIGFRHGSKR